MNRSELVGRLAFLQGKLLSNLQDLDAGSENLTGESNIPSDDISQFGSVTASGIHLSEEEPQASISRQQTNENQLADSRMPPSATKETVRAAQDESSRSSTAKWKDNEYLPSRSPLESLEGKLRRVEQQSKANDDYHSSEAAHHPPMDGRDPTQPSSSRTNMVEGLQYRRAPDIDDKYMTSKVVPTSSLTVDVRDSRRARYIDDEPRASHATFNDYQQTQRRKSRK